MKPGDEITISATELVAGGDALARIDGFPIFTASLFPGDVAVVRLQEVKKGFARAELVRLVEPSLFRRTEPCPIAGECGGCDWTALRLDKQLEAKRRILTESLRRIGKLDPAALPPIAIHPSPLNYRIRTRLHREGDVIGFYAMRSNRVVQLVRECEVVGLRTLDVFGVPGVQGSGDPEVWEIGGELVDDAREITLRAGEFAWRLSTRSFFQVNRHLHGTMIRLVQEHAARCTSRHLAIDLYAGVGFFTLPLSRHFDEVIAVEASPESARYARINAPPNVRVIEAPVERRTRRLPPVGFVFLDPPRAGAPKEVISSVSGLAGEMICYLSCDPVTFARDASRLIASGWRLSTLDLLDLFPNTHHLETLASFERAR
ncbi:MAG TPA: TRAM domain-containing protein [Thermoanaerobaculia bacterium]|nr:TRAM domain-containing protein [Thermoanaerobaculia bacterium]